ncbi:hypothetical protein [Geothrix mesophila]|uniref:hypothetical protein n=1 Tax=Geothrix mesophila TaxID=2922723 RepID=UPI001FABC90E|nr:hypothetical protein [Geothrix sp. SG198]
MTAIALSFVVLWALVCLGLRLRLHGRLLVAGTPLRTSDWVLRALGARWLPRVSLGLLIVQGVREPGVVVHALRCLGGRDVLALVVAGAFRLCATATLWAGFRAVEVHRIHRLHMGPSLIWEFAFWAHVTLSALPYILWS